MWISESLIQISVWFLYPKSYKRLLLVEKTNYDWVGDVAKEYRVSGELRRTRKNVQVRTRIEVKGALL